MIAKEKEPNNRSCSSIQTCVGEADSKKLAKISLADSSIEICIVQLTKDIECHVLEKMHHLFCYSRWWNKNSWSWPTGWVAGLCSHCWTFFNWRGNAVLQTARNYYWSSCISSCRHMFWQQWHEMGETGGYLHWRRPGNALISKWTFCQDKPESPNTFESHCAIHRVARFSAADGLPPGYFPSA